MIVITKYIEENEKRFKDDLERIDKLRNSYSLYIAFLSFNAYMFDIIVKLVTISSFEYSVGKVLFIGATIFYLIFFLTSIICFLKLFRPERIEYLPLPKVIYVDYPDKLEKWAKSQGKDIDLKKEVYDKYVEKLEQAVLNNSNYYKRKRGYANDTIYFSLITFPFLIMLIVLLKVSF
ncbi:MAG TPA: hypothetical protein PLN79_15960 [bacterium]|nr:hypothetical protein [bacterium]